MRYATQLNPLRAAGNAARRRLGRPRPGSILILVIALLMLMAVIGTAFISTARTDRYSATQNTYNTEGDLLAQGLLGQAQGMLLARIYPQSQYRPATSGAYPTTVAPVNANPAPSPLYEPYDSPIVDSLQYGCIIGDRLPTLLPPYQPTGSSFGWAYISALPPGCYLDTPYGVDASHRQLQSPLPASPLSPTNNWRVNVVPTYLNVTQPDGSVRILPAFQMNIPNAQLATGGAASNPCTIVAADTDGDGIADAVYYRLPVGQIDGATWFGSMRVIDNCAALNASVAIEPNPTPGGTRIAPGDFFPSDIDLRDLLVSGDTLALLNNYRFNYPGGGNANGENFNPNPYTDNTNGNPNTAGQRQDFTFGTPYEAEWFMLGSRLGFPGCNSTTATLNRYQAVPISEGTTMAFHFCLTNQNSSPSTILETMLPNSTYSTAVNRGAFSPGAASTWFSTIFNYGAGNMPLRPMLVARNAVSSFVPSYFPDQGYFVANGNYHFGDRVLYAYNYTDPSTNITTATTRAFICLRANNGTVPPIGGANGASAAYWAPMSWSSAPTKVNVNTGSFGQLMTAFWSVMQDVPSQPAPGGALTYPSNNVWYNNGIADTNYQQFRSPIRGSATPLTRSQVIQLRAAIAAVNAMDMRDGDEDVTSRTIALTSVNGATVYANVFGSEKQPFITEVMVASDPNAPPPLQPYIALELYNPYPTAIPLSGWKIAQMSRGASIALTEIVDFNQSMTGMTHPGTTRTGALIMPGERIVLESDPAKEPGWLTANWGARSFKAHQAKSTGAGQLVQGVGNEMVMLRPRSAVGTPFSNSSADNTFNESQLTDLVPVDQIDLTGLKDPDPNAPQGQAACYHYARANRITADNTSAAWHCVYPGGYNLAASGADDKNFRHLGMKVAYYASNSTADPNTPMTSFGLPKSSMTQGGAALATYDTRPIQINNRDSAGPNRPYADQSGNATGLVSPQNLSKNNPAYFPFGGFARAGDILSVPFIGGYKIFDGNGNTLEMNSVTMDSVYAQFQQPNFVDGAPLNWWDADNTAGFAPAFHNEQIGHFCPMDVASTDFLDDPTDTNFAANQQKWTYHWAKRLFDYLATYTPQDDYLPDADPSISSDGQQSGDPSLPSQGNGNSVTNNVKYPAALPMPTPNGPTITTPQQANVGREDAQGTEGLININTAHWKVMSAVPFAGPANDGSYLADNLALAQAIYIFRETVNNSNANFPHDGYGPFRSIFDLQKVPAFKAANAKACNNLPGELSNAGGDLSPFAGTPPTVTAATPGETDLTDHVYGDVKTRFTLLDRVSNLVTVRSDSFTIYAQVTGWQGVGTTAPGLVVQRRAAALIDRCQARPMHSPTSNAAASPAPMGVVNIPNN